ncbi:NUDIX hydrolase [Rhizobium sp. BK376]|uniref:NUDIX hydrolase n=1 Tax=Rhizobium sp. BK376 TaxID=2512149 RepID=UPI00104BCB65|nr:NUDIX hydrolase [Rhizobium sp. BK376]TCR67917.1 NUDIX domain-containing protein [Rhizobium sp. BK376]
MEAKLPRTRPLLAEIARTGIYVPDALRQQVGALCYRVNMATNEVEILLITTRKSHRWAIPKGWPMGGKAPHEAAKQEALEEAGVSGKISKKVFGHFTYLKYLPDGERVPCMVQVHLLRVEFTVAAYKERGQREIIWCSCFEAAIKVNEPELKGLFRLLYDRHRAGRLR